MKNVTIYDAQNFVMKFAHGSLEFEEFKILRNFLCLVSVEVAVLGIFEINRKHDGTFSYVVAANEDETQMVMFIYNHDCYPKNNGEYMMFCVQGEKIFQYVSSNQKCGISYDNLKSYEGLNMLATAKDFCKGIHVENLKETQNQLAKDIVSHTRALSATEASKN